MMNCKEHDALLAQALEGALTAQETASLRAHEAECEACAGRASACRSLQDNLDSLREEDLPLPEGFHRGWMAKVEEEAMENDRHDSQTEAPKPRKRLSAPWRRGLSIAAAAVFLVGGTALTRDALNPSSGGSSNTSEPMTASYGGYTSRMAESAMMDEAADTMPLGLTANDDSSTGAVQETSMVIRTADVTLGTTAFDEDLAAVKALCAQLGGRVTYASVSGDAAKSARRGSLTLRVPAAALDDLLAGTQNVGRVISRSETSEDVTASYSDTKTRLATQQAKMERLQALMSQTATLTELIELEGAIADTQYEIDTLTASLNRTSDQVDYATVDVTLREESPADTAAVKELGFGERLLSGLQTGLESFGEALRDCAVFLAAALPYLAALAVLLLVLRLVRRKGRKERKDAK